MLSFLRRTFKIGHGARAIPRAGRKRIDFGNNVPNFPIYAIGDIHGRLDLLLNAEDVIIRDANGHAGLIVCLGDYIDRGPQSSGVLSHLLKPPPQGLKRITLCGNHEAAFLDFAIEPSSNMLWLEHGGRQTLMSYGLDADYFLRKKRTGLEELKVALHEAIDPEHIALLERLPVYLKAGSYLFVHAGLRPGVPLEEQSDDDMMWIREPFLSEGFGDEITVIHGHTPISKPEFHQRRIGIDTGAYATDRLTVLKVMGSKAEIIL